MPKVKHYAPSLVLAVIAVLTLLGGPYMLRELAYADQQGRVGAAREYLKGGPLVDLNESFRSVARVVEPSVVHVSVRRRPSSDPRRPRAGSPEDEELRRWFERFEERFPGLPLPPQVQPRDPEGEARPDVETYREYDVPPEVGNGSGWVYRHPGSGEDYIITNNHVVEHADELVLKFHDKTTAKASVVGMDWKTDIAVLKVDNGRRLHPATVVDGQIDQGEVVFAFGSPLQFEFSMSQGIVSGIDRPLGLLRRQDPETGRIVRGYENFIQTDAAINPGNSGGPLVNIHGEVVGMNTAIAAAGPMMGRAAFAGLGFAIPADIIQQVANQLIEAGRVSRGYLGVYIQDMNRELAELYGFDGDGVLVSQPIGPDSPAAQAGIGAEDIIVEVNGQPVRRSTELSRRIAALAPHEEIDVKIFREGRYETVKVKLGELPEEDVSLARRPTDEDAQAAPTGPAEVLRKLGLERLATMTRELAERQRIDFVPGVLVQSVRPNSIAATAGPTGQGFQPGMIITRVGRTEVTSLAELNEALNQADLQRGVLFRVNADGVHHFIALALPE